MANHKFNRFAGAFIALTLLSTTACTQQSSSGATTAATTPAATSEHQRLLPLEGGRNFRDLGGYETADGHHVKWGLLFRSGSMTDLTPKDFDTLAKMGLRTVCDFRDTKERSDEPVHWPNPALPHVFADDYSMNTAEFMKSLATQKLNAKQAKDMMATMYRDLPYQFAGQYKRMFGELLAGRAPLAFNCSAGKDRTGVASALLLTILGVPRDTVMQDYLLSNTYYKPPVPKPGSSSAQMADILSPEVIQVLMGVDHSYLESAFAEIDKRSGSMDAFARDELGLDAADIAKLRSLYLQ